MGRKQITQKKLFEERGYVTCAAAAILLGVGVQRVYTLIEAGRLVGITVSTGPHARRYIHKASLAEYVGPEAALVLGLTIKQGA